MKISVIGFLFVLLSNIAISEEVSPAEEIFAVGKSLASAIQSKQDIKLKKISNYKELNGFLKINGCKGYKYKAYKLNDSDGYIYIVGSKGKNLIVGRHFKGKISQNSVDLSSLESSTNGCLNLGTPPSNVAAMFVTHLKEYPNEYHVSQSILRNILLYVSASGKFFNVSDKGISIVEKE